MQEKTAPWTLAGAAPSRRRRAVRGIARRRAALRTVDSSRKNRAVTCFFLAMATNGPYSQLVFACGENNFCRGSGGETARRRRGAVDGRDGQRRDIGLNALGRHLLLELFDCDPDAITNLEAVKSALVEAAKRAQATIVDVVFHEFNPFGISGVVVIAESHLSIHTWPEYRYAAVDIFSCGDVLNPEVAANYLVEQFAAERTSVVDVQRGMFLNASAPIVNKASVAVS
jgi:S-adenosylmethionine decarboxylase